MIENPKRPTADVLEGRPPLTLASAVWFMLKSQLSNSNQSRWLALGLAPWMRAGSKFKKKYFWSPAIVSYPPLCRGEPAVEPNISQPAKKRAGYRTDFGSSATRRRDTESSSN